MGAERRTNNDTYYPRDSNYNRERSRSRGRGNDTRSSNTYNDSSRDGRNQDSYKTGSGQQKGRYADFVDREKSYSKDNIRGKPPTSSRDNSRGRDNNRGSNNYGKDGGSKVQ